MNQLRNKIRSSPLLYKVFLYFKNGYKYKLPNATTNLHLTGYQRSGNTYTGNYIKTLFPKKRIVTHFHTTSSIKSALKNNVPVVVLIRNPEDCILSSILKRMEGMGLNFETAISYDLTDYINYYTYVLNKIDKLSIIHFTDAIANEKKVIEKIAYLLKVKTPDDLNIVDIVHKTKSKMYGDKRKDGDRNMPSVYKEKRKDSIRAKVQSDEQYLKCIELYGRLKRHCDNK